MKVTISQEGVLEISAESTLDAYALTQWKSDNMIGKVRLSAKGLKINSTYNPVGLCDWGEKPEPGYIPTPPSGTGIPPNTPKGGDLLD